MASSSSSNSTIDPALELAQLEIEAKSNARKNVANLLQRPDQLDKVEQIRKRVSRKKSSVEAMLKTSIQSQLDGVKNGLNQLKNGLSDIRTTKENLSEIQKSYKSIQGLGDRLNGVRQENSRHSQLATAVENLKHIFVVPETVKKCQEHIAESKLLHAHKLLTDLEGARDDLLFELSKQSTNSASDEGIVKRYFADIERLSEDLGKQLWLVLQRALMTVRREPTIIVSVLRIIEREERTDSLWKKKKQQTGFMPPNRPKHWKNKAFDVMEETVQTRIEGSQMEDRSTDKMWLVRHLELVRQTTVEDLRVVKTLCESCFPPHYDIVNRYMNMYHGAISQHLADLVHQGLEGNEIVSLLTWVSSYDSEEFMGSVELKIDTKEWSPVLDPKVVLELQNKYLQTVRSNFAEWMGNSLRTDQKDWHREQGPDADDKGYFNTQLPIILFQMIEQNLLVAACISEHLAVNVVKMCMDEMAFFVRTYKDAMVNYRDKHMQNRAEPQFYLQYMIANINNMELLCELVQKMKQKYVEGTTEGERFNVVEKNFHILANELCSIILEEVFMDLDEHVQELLTRKWLTSSLAVDTICITVEDYCQDFCHLKPRYFKMIVEKAQLRMAFDYLKAIFARKITFRSYDERAPAADKIHREADQMNMLFSKLMDTNPSNDSPFDALVVLAEMIKLRDTSMMSFEISGAANKFPDIKIDQLINVLQMREDVGRGEAKTMVIDCLGEDHDVKKKDKRTIFSQL